MNTGYSEGDSLCIEPHVQYTEIGPAILYILYYCQFRKGGGGIGCYCTFKTFMYGALHTVHVRTVCTMYRIQRMESLCT